VGRGRRLTRMDVTAVRSCRGGMRRSRVQGLVVGIVVMVVGRWERVVALAGAAVLLCRFLVGGRVWRRVFEQVLVTLDLVELVAGGSMSWVGISLRWRHLCWRGWWRVVELEEVVPSMCLLAVGIKALCFFNNLYVVLCDVVCGNKRSDQTSSDVQ
jgi:hypothetical protein